MKVQVFKPMLFCDKCNCYYESHCSEHMEKSKIPNQFGNIFYIFKTWSEGVQLPFPEPTIYTHTTT